jgi:hypothetical protein
MEGSSNDQTHIAWKTMQANKNEFFVWFTIIRPVSGFHFNILLFKKRFWAAKSCWQFYKTCIIKIEMVLS